MALMSLEASALSARQTKQLEVKTQNSVLVLNCTCTINNPIASQERNLVLVFFMYKELPNINSQSLPPRVIMINTIHIIVR